MTITARLTEELLLAELEDLPAQQAAALRVLYVADDPRSSASDLAAAVSVDPVLTAQVMRLANSAYYGLSGRVRSSDFAVTILGFATVRSLAAAYAARALGDDAVVPADFWHHAAAVAAGTAEVSSRLGVARPEAFSLGLLHDLGAALLCGHDNASYLAIEEKVTTRDSRQSALFEKKVFGMDHAEVAATMLSSWWFPDEIVEAIASHHDTVVDPTKLQRCLGAGHALGVLSGYADTERYEASRLMDRLEGSLRLGDVDPDAAFDLSRNVRAVAGGISASFGPV